MEAPILLSLIDRSIGASKFYAEGGHAYFLLATRSQDYTLSPKYVTTHSKLMHLSLVWGEYQLFKFVMAATCIADLCRVPIWILEFDFNVILIIALDATMAMATYMEHTQDTCYHLEILHFMLKIFMVLHQLGGSPLYSVPV